MKIKFLKDENVKTFTIISAIVLILFQIIKSFAAIGGNFVSISQQMEWLDYAGFQGVMRICQYLVNCLPQVVALVSAVVLAIALFIGKKNKLPVIGAAGFAVAEIITLLSTGFFGLIGLFNGSFFSSIVSLAISVLTQLVFTLAYVVFFTIVVKGCNPNSKLASFVDKLYAKFSDNTLYIPGALLMVGGVFAILGTVITAVFALFQGLDFSYSLNYLPLAVGQFGTIILYAIKGMILAIIGMSMTAFSESALNQPPVVEQIAVENNEI